MNNEAKKIDSAADGGKKPDIARAAPTSKDVARLAGVSQSAVSRVFTPGASVSDATRQRVQAAARQLGYKPNAFARGLITRHSRLIGLVFPQQATPIYSLALAEFCQRLHQAGYQTLIVTAENFSNADEAVRTFFDYQIEGLVVASATLSSSLARECAEQGLPVIQFARRERDPSISAVLSDNQHGGKLAASTLVAAACTSLAYIAGNPGTSTNEERFRGFAAHLKKTQVQVPLVIDAAFSYQDGCAAAHRLIQEAPRTDGVFCASDMIALGFMDTLRSAYRVRIPEDISVIGFDDAPEASWASYQLTTIRQDIPRLVQETCDLLMAQMEQGGGAPVIRELAVELVRRGTVRAGTA